MSEKTQSGKILVAEDQPASQKLVQILLEKLGFEVTVVADGQAAVDAAVQGGFDLILMDMQMPVISGYEATRLLRSKGVTVPVIALTAHAMAGDDRRCLEAGCNGYLAKPFRQEQLRKVLSDHFALV